MGAGTPKGKKSMKTKKEKIWVLREADYYDSENAIVGATRDEELAKAWDKENMCFCDELEIESGEMMSDFRIKRIMEERKVAKK